MRIGYFLWSEKFGSWELARRARIGEEAGSQGLISADMIVEAVPCGPNLDRHVQAVEAYEDAGFDELYIRQIGHVREQCSETHAKEILPRFNSSEIPAPAPPAAAA
jgi:hypothetical protein